MPSSNVSLISSLLAGISLRCSKLNILTDLAFNLCAVLAQSIATLPPPTTTTSPLNGTCLSKASLK